MGLDVIADFFENNPVHGFLLFSGQGEFIISAQQPENAQKKPFAQIEGTGLGGV